MKIIGLQAKEIYDCRGLPTIECTITLENNQLISASVPSGVSRGSCEAFELRDGGSRLFGMGVQRAVAIINETLSHELIGKEANVIVIDSHLLELDPTENKSTFGANTILAVSMATARAQAAAEDMPLYELLARLCNFDSVALPFPLFNMINGGMHADNNLSIQEFLAIPITATSFHHAMEIGAQLHYTLKRLLEQAGKSTAVGLEGGFAPNFSTDLEALDFLAQAIELVQSESGENIMISLDMAASYLFNQQTKVYHLQDQVFDTDELIAWYKNLCENYPIYSIEDPLSEHDLSSWIRLMQQLSSKVHIVGDDIFVTNSEKIYQTIETPMADSVIIKPNQVGTITETLQATLLCKENGLTPIISHRSAETNDSFIADLAVGVSASHIKVGGLSRGERMAKYNRLLMIEDQLVFEQMQQ